jgi:hypothetical protein
MPRIHHTAFVDDRDFVWTELHTLAAIGCPKRLVQWFEKRVFSDKSDLFICLHTQEPVLNHNPLLTAITNYEIFDIDLEAIENGDRDPDEIFEPRGTVTERTDVIKFLLEQGSDPNFDDGHMHGGGYTPLMHAAMVDYVECMEVLLQYGASIDALYANTITALHCAIESGSVKALRFLVQRGANLERKIIKTYGSTRCCGTILHYLAVHDPSPQRSTMLQILLENGCDSYVTDDDGKLPYDVFLQDPSGLVDARTIIFYRRLSYISLFEGCSYNTVCYVLNENVMKEICTFL